MGWRYRTDAQKATAAIHAEHIRAVQDDQELRTDAEKWRAYLEDAKYENISAIEEMGLIQHAYSLNEKRRKLAKAAVQDIRDRLSNVEQELNRRKLGLKEEK